MSLGIGGHARPNDGASVHWDTPPELLEILGPIDDDPSTLKAGEAFFRPWKGFVFINPPYGPRLAEWLQKLAQHGNGIALIFARTETRVFLQEVWRKADGLFFVSGRIRFLQNGKPGKFTSGGPSVLVGYGDEACRRLRGLKLSGQYIGGWRS